MVKARKGRSGSCPDALSGRRPVYEDLSFHAVQRWLMPRDWKPFNSMGAGAEEIRIHVVDDFPKAFNTDYTCFVVPPPLDESEARRQKNKSFLKLPFNILPC
jgi:hypothetical protein